METNFDRLVSILNRWSERGEKVLDNGTRLICPTPHVGSDAWLHCLFANLSTSDVDKLEEQAGVLFPEEFREFLFKANGVSLFSSNIAVFGKRFSYVRTGDASWQPFDIIHFNEDSRPTNSPTNVYFFASPDRGDTCCFFEAVGEGAYRVGKTNRDEFLPLQYWQNFWEWLFSEVRELAKQYGLDGAELA